MSIKEDWRGNEIKVGSKIIYVVAHSSSVELVEAEVVEIRELEYKTNWHNKRRTYELIVEPIRRNMNGWTPQRNDSLQTIRAVERVTVLS